MGRLGSYPHIVTVLDLGQESDQAYMVTGLMAGGDVEGVVEKAQDHRLPLEQAIKIAQETSLGLASRDLQVGEDLVAFLIFEGSQGGADLNGDRDAMDDVLHVSSTNEALLLLGPRTQGQPFRPAPPWRCGRRLS